MKVILKYYKKVWVASHPLCSKWLSIFCNNNNIKQRFSSPYNPTGNSISERINMGIGHILRIEEGKDINDVLKTVERYLNHTVNRTLRITPFQAINGYSLIDPLRRKEEVDATELKDRIYNV